ncbi:corticotropin-releasing factor receptor 1-like [Xenia sp. Carnegie-2017]|uniref:corticotropin-releasing factor receptor 1-like n=1 Tax=Xenia sp. Carnegie-2017 TaxID=2897299 RepID=UPI001F046011|nr:corticotropin-releasing factor receptor 1-like [Xenia sp. Carnegie-2017]XP_046846647.1 corticotropin-releasing factor receptor 1-like [Xenia sp. Carnegie-2017]
MNKFCIFFGIYLLLFSTRSHGIPWDSVKRLLNETCFSKYNLKTDEEQCVGKLYCRRLFRETTDCWKKTCAGEFATSTCPMIFFYTNVSLKAFCDENGKWNFSRLQWKKKCTKRSSTERSAVINSLFNIDNEDLIKKRYLKIYVIFSWLSFSFIIPSLFMLCYFMDKKNIRFNLHKNLIVAFLCRLITFFIAHYGDLNTTQCNVFWVLNRFFALSEITWMLNEAAFLMKLLFRTFDAKTYFWGLFAFGWGFPAVLVFGVYIPVMVYFYDSGIDKCWTKGKESYYMFILYGPMTLMLLMNFITLIYVICVIFDKLRHQRSSSELLRLRKGIKAALILMPLFGVIYLMILYVPSTAPTWYNYLIRILYPMQGTLACLVYVVFNAEVRQVVRARWKRWIHTKAEYLERVRPYRRIASLFFSNSETSNSTQCDQMVVTNA